MDAVLTRGQVDWVVGTWEGERKNKRERRVEEKDGRRKGRKDVRRF